MSRPRNIPISVTQSDIANGQAGVADSCPVALACRRTLGHTVYVRDSHIELKGDGSIPNPDSVTTFIDRFDGSESVDPFTFKLPLTAEQVAFLKL